MLERSGGTTNSMVGGVITSENIQVVVDQHQRRQITDGELEVLQHPLTYWDIFPADIADALNLLMEPYPTDPYVAALIFMAGMSGVLPLGTGINHHTKIFLANRYVAASSTTSSRRTGGEAASDAFFGAMSGATGNHEYASDAAIIRNQKNGAAVQEWTQWKQWALDHKNFEALRAETS